jgi:hypothetical protein
MPTTRPERLDSLDLDLQNFRIVAQPTQEATIDALIAANPPWFWALLESLLDGYLPTESILVLKSIGKKPALVVKEGNRRVAALKLIHVQIAIETKIPTSIAAKIAAATPQWKRENDTVPCVIYEHKDAAIVDRIIALVHGKGEKAGRDKWEALARARHDREMKSSSEPALDLLEAYLRNGKNLTASQRAEWGSRFNFSVLDEALPKLGRRVGVKSARAIADSYPRMQYRDELEALIHAIGIEAFGFPTLRDPERDFAVAFGFPPERAASQSPAQGSGSGTQQPVAASGQIAYSSGPAGTNPTTSTPAPRKRNATSSTDPRTIRRRLRNLKIKLSKRGERAKIVDLRDEAVSLPLEETPHAFCFLLRSMVELSAKAYCDDHAASGLAYADAKGKDIMLKDVLNAIVAHLTAGKNMAMQKQLKGAQAELSKKDGLLSLTSMNQLIHNPRFVVGWKEAALIFVNVEPLLEAMNA